MTEQLHWSEPNTARGQLASNMTAEPLSANDWPGPPRELPPLLTSGDRFYAYADAAHERADVETLAKCWQDIGQRLVIAMRGQK